VVYDEVLVSTFSMPFVFFAFHSLFVLCAVFTFCVVTCDVIYPGVVSLS
jgi:hypothetical protein